MGMSTLGSDKHTIFDRGNNSVSFVIFKTLKLKLWLRPVRRLMRIRRDISLCSSVFQDVAT